MLIAFFFFNDTATTEIYTLSLHDALPICLQAQEQRPEEVVQGGEPPEEHPEHRAQHDADAEPDPQADRTGEQGLEQLVFVDRKSTRLNSSHANISYAVFCLKKKKYNKHYI